MSYKPMVDPNQLNRVLVDNRNWETIKPKLYANLASNPSQFIGFDIETHDRDRHEGLNILMKMDGEGYKKGKKLLFDFKRSTITGYSLYFGMTDKFNCYYLNFKHADVENRLPENELLALLEEIKRLKTASTIIHNAQYELSVFLGSYDFELPQSYCSMQLAVSAYGPDEFPRNKLASAVMKGIKPLLPQIERQFSAIAPDGKTSFKQDEVLSKFLEKSMGKPAAHSYNGMVKSIAYGYGLKQAIKSWFGYSMATFEDTLGSKRDMGDLTGEDVVSYGCDDAFWCYELFFLLWKLVKTDNPQLLNTYVEQENPCTRLFAKACVQGMRVNLPEIKRIKAEARETAAEIFLDMKIELRKINFSTVVFNRALAKVNAWYTPTSHLKYMRLVQDWLATPDNLSAFGLCTQVRCATGNAWIEEKHGSSAKPSADLSINHYMAMRFVLFVLLEIPIKVEGGKVLSDKEARTDMGEHPILALYAKLGTLEQAMKLYNTPYSYLTDPITNKMHPILTSLLATRRTACQNPNGQQLSKFSETAYVRGYYQADTETQLIVSVDWSAIELVLNGEFSGDPAFAAAYSQRPHGDIHTSAAAGCLGVTVEMLKSWADYKEKRTKIGKPANFEYWYSGWLTNTAAKLGWTFERTAEAVNGYREAFPVAEKHRLAVIAEIGRKGYITLPDHHTRVRYEATQQWLDTMMGVFQSYGSDAVLSFARQALKRIQKRAGNQAVNALIQGSCATMAKRTLVAVHDDPKFWELQARWMLLVHDELLFSVEKTTSLEFLDFIYPHMIDGRGIINNLKVDSSLAIGYTFQPYHPEKAPFGQIELSEMPKGLICIPEDRWGNAASQEERKIIINYLSERNVC